jgi:hypothetical protein
MGYEISYVFHPRKEEGGYNTELTEEKTVRVGKPFDDTPLEKCAAAIMMQLARRDIWVVDVKVNELVKNEISFKESSDGKGVILKNRKFTLSNTADVVAGDLIEEQVHQPMVLPPGMQPHELIAAAAPAQSLDSLYDASRPVPIKRAPAPIVNQNKTLYFVFFDSDAAMIYANEIRQQNLKFSLDRKYPVHQVIPPPLNNPAGIQYLVVTDDTGKAIKVDEKYFSSAGRGLVGDDEVDFSGASGRREQRSKLMYENELVMDAPPPEMGGVAYKQVRRTGAARYSGGLPGR